MPDGELPDIDVQKIDLNFIAYSVKKSLFLHNIKFSNSIAQIIRFILAGNQKYMRNIWNILHTFPQY